MPFDLAVIDLDNTLYAADNGMFACMDKRITAFVSRKLGIGESEANELRLRYWKQYGTTLRGLMLHHGMAPEGFLHEVHDISVHKMLETDAKLDTALAVLPGRKVIHTNGIREHALRVMNALGVAHHFSAIYDIRFNDYRPKPCAKTLSMLIEAEGACAKRTIVIDDMEDNLAAAQSIGAQTALISTHAPCEQWNFHSASVAGLEYAIIHKRTFQRGYRREE